MLIWLGSQRGVLWLLYFNFILISSVHAEIAFLTDTEGSWVSLQSFVELNSSLKFDVKGDLEFSNSNDVFVFNGDATDRGPNSFKILAALIKFKEKYPQRVRIVLGNRDINKLRLTSELSHLGASTSLVFKGPPESRPTSFPNYAEKLKWIFKETMGAKDTFEFAREEIALGRGIEKEKVTDDDVVEKYRLELAKDGLIYKYLTMGELALRIGNSAFGHGAFQEKNTGVVPGESVETADKTSWYPSVDEWFSNLNSWARRQLDQWKKDPTNPLAGAALVAYQEPVPGTTANDKSVVYGRYSDASGNSTLPPALPVVAYFLRSGINKVFVGHTPNGDAPTVLNYPDVFTVVIADTSFRGDRRSTSILISDEKIRFKGEVGGQKFDFYDTDERLVGFLGQRNSEGFIVKGITQGNELILFKVLPGFKAESKFVPLSQVKAEDFSPPTNSASCEDWLKGIRPHLNEWRVH